jgi:hypothetical protein
MATNRHPIHHLQRGRLNHAQEMTLQYGPDPRWDAFRSEEEFRDAWIRNRDRLLAWYRHGRRPMAWWRFESPIPYPGYDRERSALFEAGLLGEEEREQLVVHWRAHFAQAQQHGFMFCVGRTTPNATGATWLKGVAAKKAHYRWSGIPRSLLREWLRSRPRSAPRPSVADRAGDETAQRPEPAPAA